MSNDPRLPVLNVIDTLADHYLKGKVQAIKLAMMSLLSGGRIQCTSDLLPSDITGLSIYDRNENQFKFIEGPVFNNLLLADEINRAMPKTQSALLEAMEEHRVTIEGKTYRLPDPFIVIATQNPVEQVGTYPLPESQLDRFLITTGIGYPPESMEKTIIQTGSIREGIREIKPLISREELLRARQAIRDEVQLSEKITGYIYRLVVATREHPMLLAGISTRGAISLADTARSHAFLAGRDHGRMKPSIARRSCCRCSTKIRFLWSEADPCRVPLYRDYPAARFCRRQHR
jgi:MoxR-like ATPase